MKVRATQSGIHLFDRNTGLNVLIDEARIPSLLWAKAPRFPKLTEDTARRAIDEAFCNALGIPTIEPIRMLLAREPIICNSLDRLLRPICSDR